MFAPSFFTGSLIKRFGVYNIIICGGLLMLVCVAVGISGTGFWTMLIALVLLGLGWNFMFIGGTTLVTESYQPNEKARTQGLNELLVFGTVSITALMSGIMHHMLGWVVTNLVVVPFVILTIGAAFWLRGQRTGTTAEGAA